MKDDGIYFLFENHPEFWTLLLCSIAVMVFSISRFAKLYMLYKDSEFNCDMLPLHSKYDESIREKYIRAKICGNRDRLNGIFNSAVFESLGGVNKKRGNSISRISPFLFADIFALFPWRLLNFYSVDRRHLVESVDELVCNFSRLAAANCPAVQLY